MDEIYLGDGVYAENDGWHIWIWTSDGVQSSQKIALEPKVLDSLVKYRSMLLERVRRKRALALEDGESE